MTNSLLLMGLGEYYNNNLERYIKEHPGEYILIEHLCVESFYKDYSKVEESIHKKYGDSMSYTIFCRQIPEKIPEEKVSVK